jgi:hypothetical protein
MGSNRLEVGYPADCDVSSLEAFDGGQQCPFLFLDRSGHHLPDRKHTGPGCFLDFTAQQTGGQIKSFAVRFGDLCAMQVCTL